MGGFPIYGPQQLPAKVSFEDLIDPVARAFAEFSRGIGESPVYVLHPSETGDVHVKSAFLRGHPYYVVKIASWFAARAERDDSPSEGFVAVFDASTGDVVALLRDEHYLSDARTAAAGAVAARALAPQTVRTVGVLGTGVQAHLQILALRAVRPFEELRVWGRDRVKAGRLAERFRAEGSLAGVRVEVASDPRKVVDAADTIVTATGSREPLVRGQWLRPGQHVTAVGADDALKCELDGACLRRADRLVVDSCAETALYGDVHRAVGRGELAPEGVHGELGEVLAGTLPGRRAKEEVTIAKLIGLGVQDLAAAEVALRKLRGDRGRAAPPRARLRGGLDPHLAAATSMWAFLFAGAAGTLSYANRRSIDWRTVAWLGVGAVPAAVVGARANVALPDRALLVLLAALTIVAGADALIGRAAVERPRSFGAPALAAIGVVVGFGSALTGTGGPVLLVPILLYLRAPVLAAVGASQAVQLPVAASSTVGYVLFGKVDFVLGSALGLAAVVGVLVGSRVAHAAPAKVLRQVVAVSLVGAGLLVGARAPGAPPTDPGEAPRTPAGPATAAPAATFGVEAYREAAMRAREA